ncbi:MAG: tautomerase family protein [Pseudomonadota bacterium]
MPFVSLMIAKSDLPENQTKDLIEAITRLMTEVMNKRPERVTVQISTADPQKWAVGRKTVADMDRCAVRMQIEVTEGTNTLCEKEDMVAQATKALDDILGIELEATYIVISEVPGVSWGKGGLMLADRTKADREEARRKA